MSRRIAEKRSGRYARLTASLLLPLLLGSCDRRAARAEPAGDSSAPTDTVVRRVVRLLRTPTMLQRATGAVAAFHALQPLDSPFVVRVMDQRGMELPGVRVSWTLQSTGDGASLRVLDARTDSLGLSRVVFTPGRTALPQTVLAAVENVGEIPFRVEVPAVSIRLAADPPALWSDDRTIVSAELRDLRDVALTGGPLGWGTSDSSVIVIESVDGSLATVRGRLAGSADVVAWVEPGRVRSNVSVRVRPTVRGVFATLDGSPLPPMRLELRSGAARESVTVVDGRFTARPALPSYSDVEVHAVPAAPAFHPVHARVPSPRALQDLRITLIPTAWRIERGSYAGRDVAIDATEALKRTGRGGAFWRLPPVGRTHPPVIIGWPPAAFPLRIAFDRRRSRDAIVSADSVAFWRIAAQMHADLGATFFVPAQLPGDTATAGIVAVETGTDMNAGHTFVTWNESGDAYDGTVMFRNSSTLRDPHVVTHELLHLLGFGHAPWPRTVSTPAGGTEQRLTPEDVAYVQLALRLREFQVRTGARPGLPTLSP